MPTARNIKSSLRPPLQRLNRHLPHRLDGASRPVSTSLYSIYRARNTAYLTEFIASLGPGVRPHLHALDQITEPLQAWTRSTGGGVRTDLLRKLMKRCPPTEGDDLVVIADDDVTLQPTRAPRFLSYVLAARFDFAQPAHAVGSVWNYDHLVVKPFSTARQVEFVEVGPVVVLSPRAQACVLPLPEDAGMGWGLDLEWWALAQQHHLRQGVVDATPMWHHGPVGGDYTFGPEEQRLAASLERLGVESIFDITRSVNPKWRPGRGTPPW